MKVHQRNSMKLAKLHYHPILLTGVIAIIIVICSLQMCRPKTRFFPINQDIQAEKPSPRKWAKRIELPGLPNFYKVSDALYRGAQPTAEGMRQLKMLGIKTVVNLRSFHSDRDEIADNNFIYEHIYMKPWHPEDKEAVRFLKIVTDKSKTPVFVHCQRGADRTGVMCAIYRIVVQDWSKQQAIEEMTKGGFGFHTAWVNLIEYIKDLDVEKIKQTANL